MSQIRLNDTYFKYTGTGYELFIGFLRFLPFLVFFLLFRAFLKMFFTSFENIAVQLFFFIFVLYFYYLISYCALRYLLSRTNYNKLPFGLRGSARQYALIQLRCSFFQLITLYLFSPVFDIELKEYVLKNMFYGRTKFLFKDLSHQDLKMTNRLWVTHMMTWILSIPTLGISRLWYDAQLTRYLYKRVHLGDLRFQSHHTGRSEFFFHLTNNLILIFTLGLGIPIAIQRKINYFVNHSLVIGNVQEFISMNFYTNLSQKESDAINTSSESSLIVNKERDLPLGVEEVGVFGDIGMFGIDFTLE